MNESRVPTGTLRLNSAAAADIRQSKVLSAAPLQTALLHQLTIGIAPLHGITTLYRRGLNWRD